MVNPYPSLAGGSEVTPFATPNDGTAVPLLAVAYATNPQFQHGSSAVGYDAVAKTSRAAARLRPCSLLRGYVALCPEEEGARCTR